MSVFRQCATALFMVKDQHPQAVKETIASVLPVWLESFKVLLNLDLQREVQGNWDGLSIRIQVFKVRSIYSKGFTLTELTDARYYTYLIPPCPDPLPSWFSHLCSPSSTNYLSELRPLLHNCFRISSPNVRGRNNRAPGFDRSYH